jgi:hypothetical protein
LLTFSKRITKAPKRSTWIYCPSLGKGSASFAAKASIFALNLERSTQSARAPPHIERY